jgi:glucose uptake protein GlcU
MSLIFPLASIIAESAGKTVDKLNFARNHIAPRQLMWLVFVGMSLSMLLFIVVTRQPFPTVTLVSVGLVALIALVSFASNVLDVFSLKADDLSLREPMNDFQVLLAGLVAYVLFPAERKPAFLVVFVLGVFIMRWGTHRRRLRNFQKKGMSFFLFSCMLEALLPSIYKITLGHISPSYIALSRVVAILVLSTIFFPPKKTYEALTSKKVLYSLTSGVIYAIGTVTSLYAIHVLGVVQTMLILLLGPSLHYLAGYFILKEKVRGGEVASSALLAAIALVAFFI